MSKSTGNYIGVSEPPEEIFGKVMRVPDGAMEPYHRLLLDGELDPALSPVQVKRRLARALVGRFHGEDAGRAAEAKFDRLHRDRQAPDEIEDATLPDQDPVNLPDLIADNFGVSRSEVRRLLAQGGVRLDGAVLGPDELEVARDRLDGRVLQLGKRRFKRFRRGMVPGGTRARG
jgi:tyrosyl-tRNA synthetase